VWPKHVVIHNRIYYHQHIDIYGINVLTTTKVINIFTVCIDGNYKLVEFWEGAHVTAVTTGNIKTLLRLSNENHNSGKTLRVWCERLTLRRDSWGLCSWIFEFLLSARWLCNEMEASRH
jgi:hypothetical protein